MASSGKQIRSASWPAASRVHAARLSTLPPRSPTECDAHENSVALQAGEPAEPFDVGQDVPAPVPLDEPPALQLGEDPGHVLAAPTGEGGEVRVGDHRRNDGAVLGKLVEARRA